MILSLTTPVGSNFIKDWPAQNEINCDLIDSYAGQCLPTHDLGIYTPQLLGSSTNPSLGTSGNGARANGYYYRIFDQVYVWGEIRFASSGISIGSGFYSVTLPFTATTGIGANATMARGLIVGNGFVYDNSAAGSRQPVVAQLRTTDSIHFGVRNNSGGVTELMTEANPIAWAVSDGLLWHVRYKRAS